MAKAIVKGGYMPGDTIEVDLNAETDQITFTRVPAPVEED